MLQISTIMYLLEPLVCLLCFTIKWILLYVFILLVITNICSLIRFVKIKISERVKADGSKGILITGATSGFGLLMAKHFYKLGFSVFACYYNDREAGYGELLELSKLPEQIGTEESSTKRAKLFLVRMDVRSRESIKQAHQEVEKILDKHNMELYCIVNNAGISKVGPFEWIEPESLTQSIDTNLTGALLVTRQFILRIIQSKGRVVNVSSGMQSFSNIPGVTVYGCTKAALKYFSESLHRDIKAYGASCHCVLPGNYITTSNILYGSIKCLQDSEKKLTTQEREIYKDSINSQSQIIYGLLRSKLSKTKENPQQIENDFNIHIPKLDNLERGVDDAEGGFFSRLLRKFVHITDGRSNNLEDSGVIDGFDQAVCLKNAPRNIYAGTPIYAYCMGPSTDHLSPLICNLLSGSLHKYVQED